jgi:glycerol-3-phosphate acyltransferase PlsY
MQFNKDINLLLLFISIIILIKHYSNILRLFNKTESKIKF